MKTNKNNPKFRRLNSFTLAEVLTAIVITAVVCVSVIYGYIYALNNSEWSAYSLAAQSLAIQKLEQTRSCKWDTSSSPPIDELVSSNFPISIDILDIPIKGTNIVYATNTVIISDISLNPPLKMITVYTLWRFRNRAIYSNTISTYRAPDQ